MIRPVAGGSATEFEVRAQPGAARPGLVGGAGGGLKVRLSSPPVDGRANEELVAVVAEALGLRPREVTLVRGHTARSKTLRIERPEVEVRTLLAPWIGQNEG